MEEHASGVISFLKCFIFIIFPPSSHFWRLGTAGQSCDKHLILLYVPFQTALHFGFTSVWIALFLFLGHQILFLSVCHAAHFYSVRKLKKQIQKGVASHQKILSSCLFSFHVDKKGLCHPVITVEMIDCRSKSSNWPKEPYSDPRSHLRTQSHS